jgi:hypothetical protein
MHRRGGPRAKREMIYCLYVQNASPNAYTLAIAGKQPFIMLNTGLLELLNTEELQGVIAHEVRSPVEQRVIRNVGSPHSRYVLLQLGHLKCDHGVWLTVGNVLANGTIRLLPVMSSAVEDSLFRWMRAAELTCDRHALVLRALFACLYQTVVHASLQVIQVSAAGRARPQDSGQLPDEVGRRGNILCVRTER